VEQQDLGSGSVQPADELTASDGYRKRSAAHGPNLAEWATAYEALTDG